MKAIANVIIVRVLFIKKTEQLKRGKLGRRERLDMLQAKRKDVEKLKKEIHELEDTFKKRSRGGDK